MISNQRVVSTAMNIEFTVANFGFISGLFPTQPKQYEKDFDVIKVDTHSKFAFGVKMMRAAQRFPEVGETPYATFSTYGTKSFTFPTYGIQLNITRIMLMDNLYQEQVPQMGTAFLQSAIEAINIEVADFYRRGFTNESAGLDGLPLYGSHPTDAGATSNTIPTSMFNLFSLTQAMINMWRFRAPNGFQIGNTHVKALTLSPEFAPLAYTILESVFTPGSGDFSLNPAQGMRYAQEVHVNPYIPKNTIFLRTNIPGFFLGLREPFNISQAPNFSTWSLTISSFMRFCVDFWQWEAGLGYQTPLEGANYFNA